MSFPNELPRGWKLESIISSVTLIMDYRGRTPRKLGMGWGDGTIMSLSARNVRMGYIDFSEEVNLGSEALYRRWMTSGDMYPGDVLITTEAPLGNVAMVPDNRKYILSQRTVLLRPNSILFDSHFFLKCLQSPDFQKTLFENATGSTALGIQRKRLEQLVIYRPPLAEQKRIAPALKDTDDLISALERTIDKKQAIKQGMMQELLTGKTRLPGFNDQWIERSLGSIAQIKTGSRNNQDKKASGQYPFFVRSATVERIDSYSYDCEAILVPGEGGIGSIFHYINGRFEVHQRVYKISDFKPNAHGRFVYHYMQQFFGAHAMENSVKATVDSLRLPTFRNFSLCIPGSVDEQRAISEALDDATLEIEVLERRLMLSNAIKQGMMQELLTGRTRLPIPEDLP